MMQAASCGATTSRQAAAAAALQEAVQNSSAEHPDSSNSSDRQWVDCCLYSSQLLVGHSAKGLLAACASVSRWQCICVCIADGHNSVCAGYCC
jgi:hypothetical protein